MGRSCRETRAKIAAANAKAECEPQKRIIVRAREALKVLLNQKQCSQVGERVGGWVDGCPPPTASRPLAVGPKIPAQRAIIPAAHKLG